MNRRLRLPFSPLSSLILGSMLAAQPVLAASDSDSACDEARDKVSQQIKQARLKDDTSRRAMLEARLQMLNERCRGVVPLQANHDEIERATRLATLREAQLREALGTGDRYMIELSERRLDQARQQVEAAKR